MYPEATEAFLTLGKGPTTLPDEAFRTIERFIILMYNRSSQNAHNTERQDLFARHSRQIENISPTEDALRLHVLRATYQAGHVWGNCHAKDPPLPDPSAWGWRKDPIIAGGLFQWNPVWTTLPQAEKSCHELIKCSCKKGCTNGRCTCRRNSLNCTSMCCCGGDC